jgi:superfamily II DNA/RNA helicase
VSVIVHFDPPTTHKDYVHRSGRTGRAGADGKVVSLVGRESAADVRQIQKALRMPPRLDHPDVSTLGPKIQIAQRPAMETHPAAEKKKQHGNKNWRHPGEKGRRPKRRPQQMRRTG